MATVMERNSAVVSEAGGANVGGSVCLTDVVVPVGLASLQSHFQRYWLRRARWNISSNWPDIKI